LARHRSVPRPRRNAGRGRPFALADRGAEQQLQVAAPQQLLASFGHRPGTGEAAPPGGNPAVNRPLRYFVVLGEKLSISARNEPTRRSPSAGAEHGLSRSPCSEVTGRGLLAVGYKHRAAARCRATTSGRPGGSAGEVGRIDVLPGGGRRHSGRAARAAGPGCRMSGADAIVAALHDKLIFPSRREECRGPRFVGKFGWRARS